MRAWPLVLRIECSELYSTGTVCPMLTCYTQPAVWYYAAKIYHRWVLWTWPLVKHLEKLLQKRHESLCENDCTIAFDMTDQIPVRICGYLPLGARQDLKCYDLGEKGKEILDSREGPPIRYYESRCAD